VVRRALMTGDGKYVKALSRPYAWAEAAMRQIASAPKTKTAT